MGVLIKDIDKPKSCYAVIDGESKYCPFVNKDDDCVLQLVKGTVTWEEQYSKCPLVETSESCEDVINRQAAIKAIEENKLEIWLNDYDRCNGYNEGLETALEEIKNLPSAQSETSLMTVTVAPDSEEIERVVRKIKDAPVMMLPSTEPDEKLERCRFEYINACRIVTFFTPDTTKKDISDAYAVIKALQPIFGDVTF